MVEKVRLRIGSVAKAVLVTGQAYQDPKDALNEFVSNAADEYLASSDSGQRIRAMLRRRGRYLATLVAKEYVVYNNPMAAPPELAEEMVRMVVRVRRHLTPRK